MKGREEGTVLRAIDRGCIPVADIERATGMRAVVLVPVLRGLVERGLVSIARTEYRTGGCRGCGYQGKCDRIPGRGYSLAGEHE